MPGSNIHLVINKQVFKHQLCVKLHTIGVEESKRKQTQTCFQEFTSHVAFGLDNRRYATGQQKMNCVREHSVLAFKGGM